MEYLYSFLIGIGILMCVLIVVGIAICGLLFVSDWLENRFEDFPVWIQVILKTIKWAVIVFVFSAFLFLLTMAVRLQFFA